MPTVEVAKFDMERLTGLSYREVEKFLEYVKCQVEEDLGDRVKLEVTHDRPDHFSAEGLARTLKGMAEVELGLPKIKLAESSVELKTEHIEERPYITMAIVRDVRLDDEAIRQMIQLQEKLHDTYGRGRRRVAIGFYDLAKIKPPIYYRRVSREAEYTPLGFEKPMPVGEMFEKTEQGRKYSYLISRETPPALVDSEGQIMVIVPVLASECCKITSSTRDVLIDVTGTELRSVTNVMSVLLYSVLERSLSREVEVVTGGNTYRHTYLQFDVDEKRASSLLGVPLSRQQFVRGLEKSRHEYTGVVTAAPYRINLLSWIDVVEDIALALGYNNFPREPPAIISVGRRHAVEVLTREFRKIMTFMGFTEVNNYVLTDESVSDICKPIKVVNPISELYNRVRCTQITQLIATAAVMRQKEVKLFEVGEVVRDGKTRKVLTFLVSRDGVTLTDGLAILKALCKASGYTCITKSAQAAAWALQGRFATIDGDISGYIAEVNPDLLTKLGHYTPVVVAELFLA